MMFYNHKIYLTEDIAKETVKHINWGGMKFRILPVYVYKNKFLNKVI